MSASWTTFNPTTLQIGRYFTGSDKALQLNLPGAHVMAGRFFATRHAIVALDANSAIVCDIENGVPNNSTGRTVARKQVPV